MNKFEKAYNLVKDDLSCPKSCKVCENESLLFLPGEVEFLSKEFKVGRKLAIPNKVNRNAVWLTARNDRHCSFYKFGK